MEKLMFKVDEYQRLHNCSFYDVNQIPQKQRKNAVLGLILFTVTSIEVILYVPCLCSIWHRRRHTFYKFMFVMGLSDLTELVVIGPVTGCLAIAGIVFCEHPTFVYVLGAIGVGAIFGQQLMDLLLALNRCLYFVAPDTAWRLFPEGEGWTWAWTLLPLAIQITYTIFGTPAIFSSITGFWMWNPHFGYANELHEQYANGISMFVYTVENYVIMIALPLVYFIFFIAVRKCKAAVAKDTPKGLGHISTTPIFKQVAVISVVQSTNSFLTIFLIHSSNPSFALMIVFLLFHTQTCGIAPVIYLLFSKKIQKDVRKMAQKARKTFLHCLFGPD